MSGILTDLTKGARRLAEIKKDFSDLEFKERILELRELLLAAKEEILNRDTEIAELKATLMAHERRAELQSNLLEVEGFKYEVSEGKPVGLPFCPTCEVKEDGKLYRLGRMNDQYSECPNCKYSFNAGSNGLVHGKRTRPPIHRKRGFV
ncbi:hypothetical protein [Yoonia sp. BS5-3]|uniref:Uncharacterized protein n=1 Tax=Yoonia phaeophyticola TaxID=3137369 RepID=A0ABZ2V823_9RHOB